MRPAVREAEVRDRREKEQDYPELIHVDEGIGRELALAPGRWIAQAIRDDCMSELVHVDGNQEDDDELEGLTEVELAHGRSGWRREKKGRFRGRNALHYSAPGLVGRTGLG